MAAIYAPQAISKKIANQIFKTRPLRGRAAKFWLNCTNEKKDSDPSSCAFNIKWKGTSVKAEKTLLVAQKRLTMFGSQGGLDSAQRQELTVGALVTAMASRAAAISLAAVSCALAAPAWADQVQLAYYDQGQRAQFAVPVTATVGGRCGFNAAGIPSGQWDAGEIDVPGWSHQFTFTLECTGLSRVAVTSTNGGLKNANSAASPGFAALAPYNVKLNVLHNSGAVVSTCASDALSASGSGCNFKGDAALGAGVFIPSPSYNLGNSYVEVSYAAPAAGPTASLLSAGQYSDTLTITISPTT